MPNAEANRAGAAWLLADMVLNLSALTIVKALGLGYPAAQLVFLRAAVGLVLMSPWIWAERRAFLGLDRWGLHVARVAASTLALTCSYFAVARLPFALVSAMGFTRPVVMMVLAVIFLGETVGHRRWTAAAVAFLGVVIAVQPGQAPWDWGLLAMAGTVVFGSAAVILMRRLIGVPAVVLMTFYTGGLAALTLPLALAPWAPLAPGHLLPLLAMGAFAQCAQFCFLRAHARAEATLLAMLAYLSLILTAAMGYLAFGEVPSPAFALGALLIVAATLWTTLRSARA